MIEAALLTMAIGFMILLLRNSTRKDLVNPDELLGLFAYKQDKNEKVISHRREKKRNA
jgi:hypothetical protein